MSSRDRVLPPTKPDALNEPPSALLHLLTSPLSAANHRGLPPSAPIGAQLQKHPQKQRGVSERFEFVKRRFQCLVFGSWLRIITKSLISDNAFD